MNRKKTPFSFPNGRGETLSGIIDSPANSDPLFYGVFAPCFTCVKESHGATKICRAMAERGGAMLRFDLTGLGQSAGDFAAQNFTTRILDIVAACQAIEKEFGSAELLVGHSISGTAAISAAHHLPDLKVLATIGSPQDPMRTIEKFRENNLITEKDGIIEIDVLGLPTKINASFINDMLHQDTVMHTETLNKKFFIFHAPHDKIVAYSNAETILSRAEKNKIENNAALMRLDDAATHLFEKRDDDAEFIARTLVNRL